MTEPKLIGLTGPAGSGNTLLRGTDGSETAPDYIDAAKTMQIINGALKPCPEIDAITREMADQAEQAYETLAQHLGIETTALSLMDLVNKTICSHITLSENASTLTAERDFLSVRSNGQATLLGDICRAIDLSTYSTGPEILAEVENVARLAQRNIELEKLPYVVITHVHSEEISDLAKAKRKAESVADHSSEGHAAIARVVASVRLKPVWSDRI